MFTFMGPAQQYCIHYITVKHLPTAKWQQHLPPPPDHFLETSMAPLRSPNLKLATTWVI